MTELSSQKHPKKSKAQMVKSREKIGLPDIAIASTPNVPAPVSGPGTNTPMYVPDLWSRKRLKYYKDLLKQRYS